MRNNVSIALYMCLLTPVLAYAEQDLAPGLVAEYFSCNSNLADFPALAPNQKPVVARVEKNVNYDEVSDDFYGTHLIENFYARWNGILRVEKAGHYSFFTTSDDGSRLFIDGKAIVDNGGPHGMTEKEGATDLTAGDHALKIEYFQGGGGAGCKVYWKTPDGNKEPVPAKVLFHTPGSEKIDVDKTAAAKRKPQPAKKSGGRWSEMDYGQTLAATYNVSPDNLVPKGVSIRVSKEKEAYVLFDTELLRLSAAWSGGFVDGRNVAFDGSHDTNLKPLGAVQIGTRVGPGWAKDGSFSDPREPEKHAPEPKDGPLPADWAKYKGLYMCGDKTVLSYTVGDCKVLELPGVEFHDADAAFSRTFNFGPSTKPLTLLVCEVADAKGGGTENNIASIDDGEAKTLASLVDAPKGTEWSVDSGKIILKLPPFNAPTVCKLVMARLTDATKFPAFLKGSAENLQPLTHGGAPHWTEPVVTKGVLGAGDGPYAVDTLTAPEKNPWNSWLRFGGMDFFADGKRAALCTWSGDVWIVSGIDDKLENLTWKRFATGLDQTLGLKIVNDVVYTLGRDQITRLHDLNNDGEADYYENFNNDVCVTPGFHEFAFDLQTDSQGNFYYAKGSPVKPGGSGFTRISKHNGTLLKVAYDGSKTEVIATGFRAPNGIGVGPHDEITTGDNEGTWTPSCPINWIKKGGFYGVVDSAHTAQPPTKRENPICWMPWKVDRSSGCQVWVTSDHWGPFQGHLLHLSYGMCSLFHVMYEHVGEEIQGGVCRFPLEFASGINRARFNAVDGQLYLSGIRGWQTSAAKDCCFQRVRYTGKPVHFPFEMHVLKTGIAITFTDALDAASATDLENWSASWFNIKWTAAYGSDLYSPNDPNKRYSAKDGKAAFGDDLAIKSVKLSPDGKTVTLEIPEIKPVTNVMINFKIKAADGTPIKLQICNTINVMP